MSKFLKSSTLIAILLSLFLVNVNAEHIYYTNLNGVEMTRSQYIKMLELYSEKKVTSLTQDEFDLVVNAEIVDSEKAYYKLVSNTNGVLYEEQVTEAEFYSMENIPRVCGEIPMDDDSGYFNTSYKSFSAALLDFDDYFYLISDLSWTIMPACRSYDVFAFRTTHMTYDYVSGTQTYYHGSNYTNVGYGDVSLGYKGLNNGAGISMNLVDDTTITGLDLSLSAILNISEYNYSQAHVFVSYQHAQSDLSREDSMSYTLSAGGLGNVIYYTDYSIKNKYDNMSGLELMTPIPQYE